MRKAVGIVVIVMLGGTVRSGAGPAVAAPAARSRAIPASGSGDVTAATAALQRLRDREGCPAATDTDLRALAAPRDDAPELTAPSLDSFKPLVDLSEAWKPLLQAMQTRGCATGSVSVGIALVRWNRATLLSARKLLDTVWKDDPQRGNREQGANKIEVGLGTSLAGLFTMAYELKADAATMEAVWALGTDRTTYEPLSSTTLHGLHAAMTQQVIPRATASGIGTRTVSRLRMVAATIAAVERGKPAPAVRTEQVATGTLQPDGWVRIDSPNKSFSVAWPTQAATMVMNTPGEPTGEVIAVRTKELGMTAVCMDKRPELAPLAFQKQTYPDATDVRPAPAGAFEGIRFVAGGRAHVRMIAAGARTCLMIVELLGDSGAVDRAMVDRFFASLRFARTGE